LEGKDKLKEKTIVNDWTIKFQKGEGGREKKKTTEKHGDILT